MVRPVARGYEARANQHDHTQGVDRGHRGRYRSASKSEKQRILDEFVTLTGFHRKRAIRALNCERVGVVAEKRRKRIYDESVRHAMIILREAAVRVCGNGLKALVPVLIDAMDRHGHLDLEPIIKDKILAASAATINRMLAGTRLRIDGQRKRRNGVGAALPSLTAEVSGQAGESRPRQPR